MKVMILDKIFEYRNDKKIIDEVLKQVDKEIADFNVMLSHFDIDGKDIYYDFYDYILDHIKEIKEIHVITKTTKEMHNEILLSTLDYIIRAIPEIEILSNEFYKSSDGNRWNKLIDLFEGINWIITTFIEIDSNINIQNILGNYEKWNDYVQDVYYLKDVMKELEYIVKSNDLVSIADILSYEINSLFSNMKQKLESLLCREEIKEC